eukprot:7147215-Pyramimonas_sp.AAC.1
MLCSVSLGVNGTAQCEERDLATCCAGSAHGLGGMSGAARSCVFVRVRFSVRVAFGGMERYGRCVQ